MMNFAQHHQNLYANKTKVKEEKVLHGNTGGALKNKRFDKKLTVVLIMLQKEIKITTMLIQVRNLL